jgi:uncharacterized protein (DUF1697 family)
MTRYAALLRGVNVGGITIKSAELAEVFVSLGFDGVKTVLASGNVLFETDAHDDPALKTRIEKALRDRFGYDAWIVLVRHDTLEGLVTGFPYDETDDAQPYVVFVSDPKVLTELTAFVGDIGGGDERAEAGTGVLYWSCPKGHSLDTPVAKRLAKPAYKSTTTTRNLRTLRRLL